MTQSALQKTLKARFAPEALSDIDALLSYSLKQFGLIGSQRYAMLLDCAVSDLCAQPARLGISAFGAGSRSFFAYHLKFSNQKLTASARVGKPRHLIFFRVQGDWLMISRVLHDAMDFLQHLDLA